MSHKKFLISFVFSLFVFCNSYSQSELKVVNIGDFKTENGSIIGSCKIGYRTYGFLNDDKSNVVLMPTWHMGNSKDNLEYLLSIIDAKGLYLIVVDALGNGVSSSPSNYPNFPEITTKDMVNSQYKLLNKHLKINKIKTLIGVSQGGMQALEWMVSYPDFMKEVISIIGSPKVSFYDLALWSLYKRLIVDAGNDKEKIGYAMDRITDMSILISLTPSYNTSNYKPEDYTETFLEKKYSYNKNAHDKVAQMNAIITHDIYKNNLSLENIKEIVKAKVLIINSKQDHVVNPKSSEELAKILDCDFYEFTGDCGHLEPFCEAEKVKELIYDFLK